MRIEEIAAELGKALKEDARLVELEAARKAYEESEELRTLMTEYEVNQKAIEFEAAKPESEELLLKIQNRLDEIYDKIMEHPVFVRLNTAQAEVNAYMETINNIITFNITGELPTSCTHDCSSCGGSCNH
ncbi:MAG: YlbF family regulator [Ruminococcaceae bacterium]|nr:YlbF family regulator [Oscillospiraceae bacterium]